MAFLAAAGACRLRFRQLYSLSVDYASEVGSNSVNTDTASPQFPADRWGNLQLAERYQ